MGEAKRRRAEIEALKRLGPPIDPISSDPEPTAEMARRLHSMLQIVKLDGNIDPPMQFLYSKLDTTILGFGQLPIACKKGCSHCCYIWVSATAPELLFIAKKIRAMGEQTIDRVRTAHIETKDFGFDVRDQHPHPCPLLEQDICSIYESRPKACRLAASG